MKEDIVLYMEGISKEFPGVLALDNVSFELKKGEVHAICGENGAGKSTLLKVLNGLYRKDAGKVYLMGKEINIKNIQHARENGISVIPQEIQLAPKLSVQENIFMGQYPKTKLGFVNWHKMREDAKAMQEKLGESAKAIGIEVEAGELSMGHKQLIEILKALTFDIKILALDEPTSSLSEEETNQLFSLIKDLTKKGISIIYVSHRLKEIFEIADRVTVFKDGKYVGTKAIKDTTYDDVVSMMVGRNLDLFGRKEGNIIKDETLLEVRDYTSEGVFKDISFKLRKGEILGLFGIVGSGRTEVARAIFGVDPKTSGEMYLDGQPVSIKTPMDAVKQGLGFVPEDRHGQGLVLGSSVRLNLTMPFIKKLSKLSFINHLKEKKTAYEYIKALNIKTPSDTTHAESLSGGNQQKIVIAKWLAAKSRVLIFDEPTRGIDVGAKSEIYRLMKALAKEGKGIIMISSELPEILALSDRILVFKDGIINAEFENSPDLTEEEICTKAIMQ
jgi:ABC-type sugar transport system ATPase subunit